MRVFLATVSPTSVNCFSESTGQWTRPSRKEVPGRNLTEQGAIPIVNKLTMTVCQERPLAAHTNSEGYLKAFTPKCSREGRAGGVHGGCATMLMAHRSVWS